MTSIQHELMTTLRLLNGSTLEPEDGPDADFFHRPGVTAEYDHASPLEFRLVFAPIVETQELVVWQCSVDHLGVCLTGSRVGEGDVRMTPDPRSGGHILVTLSSPEGAVELCFERSAMKAFYDAIRAVHEAQPIDLAEDLESVLRDILG